MRLLKFYPLMETNRPVLGPTLFKSNNYIRFRNSSLVPRCSLLEVPISDLLHRSSNTSGKGMVVWVFDILILFLDKISVFIPQRGSANNVGDPRMVCIHNQFALKATAHRDSATRPPLPPSPYQPHLPIPPHPTLDGKKWRRKIETNGGNFLNIFRKKMGV